MSRFQFDPVSSSKKSHLHLLWCIFLISSADSRTRDQKQAARKGKVARGNFLGQWLVVQLTFGPFLWLSSAKVSPVQGLPRSLPSLPRHPPASRKTIGWSCREPSVILIQDIVIKSSGNCSDFLYFEQAAYRFFKLFPDNQNTQINWESCKSKPWSCFNKLCQDMTYKVFLSGIDILYKSANFSDWAAAAFPEGGALQPGGGEAAGRINTNTGLRGNTNTNAHKIQI